MLDDPAKCPAHQAKCSTYESEAEQNKQLQAVEGTTAAQRLRDKDKRIASLEEELEGVKDQADDLDRMLRDTRSKVGPTFQPVDQSTRGRLQHSAAVAGSSPRAIPGFTCPDR